MQLPQIRLVLVNDWRSWRTKITTYVAALASAIGGYVIAYPDAAAQVLNELPSEARTWISPFAGIAMFVFIFLARMTKSAEITRKTDATGTATLAVLTAPQPRPEPPVDA
jgi:hypothetical protein